MPSPRSVERDYLSDDTGDFGAASRAKLESAFAYGRILGARYLEYLAHDRAALERSNHLGGFDLGVVGITGHCFVEHGRCPVRCWN